MQIFLCTVLYLPNNVLFKLSFYVMKHTTAPMLHLGVVLSCIRYQLITKDVKSVQIFVDSVSVICIPSQDPLGPVINILIIITNIK